MRGPPPRTMTQRALAGVVGQFEGAQQVVCAASCQRLLQSLLWAVSRPTFGVPDPLPTGTAAFIRPSQGRLHYGPGGACQWTP